MVNETRESYEQMIQVEKHTEGLNKITALDKILKCNGHAI